MAVATHVSLQFFACKDNWFVTTYLSMKSLAAGTDNDQIVPVADWLPSRIERADLSSARCVSLPLSDLGV